MAAVHLVAVFCARVITGVHSVMGRLVRVRTVKWVHTGTAVSCAPIMFRDRSAIAVNLDTGGCRTTAVEVRLWALKSSLPSIHTSSRQAEFRIWLVELINRLESLDYECRLTGDVRTVVNVSVWFHALFWFPRFIPDYHDSGGRETHISFPRFLHSWPISLRSCGDFPLKVT